MIGAESFPFRGVAPAIVAVAAAAIMNSLLFIFMFILSAPHYHPIGGTDSFLLNGAYNTITQFPRQ